MTKGPIRGVFAFVDLTHWRVEKLEVRSELYRQFIGGASLAAALYFKLAGRRPAPLSPENPLIFATGPLTGTRAPTSGRYAVASRSPLTGIWGEAISGGFFGPYLKFAGFDGIIFVGASAKPVYAWVSDGRVELRDASELWGLGVYQAMKSVREETDKRASVACIGPAGENLVSFAAIINDHGRAAARTGLGAVMGSKKLKAIATLGSEPVTPVSEEFDEVSRELWKSIASSPSAQALRELGTVSYFEIGPEFGDVPAKYFTSLEFDYAKLSGMRLKEEFTVEATACYMCPIGCGRRVKLESLAVDGPEYESAASLGALNQVEDLRDVVLANHMCNDLGLDTISTGVAIAFLSYAAEKGYIQAEPAWGRGERVMELIRSVAYREGLGDFLAEGVLRASRRLGVPEELAAHVKGLEIPMHDPRAFFSVALSYATGPRGACHLRADTYLVDMGAFIDESAGLEPGDFHTLEGKARLVATMQNLREVYNAAVLCIFSNLPSQEVAKLLTLATGFEMASPELLAVGARSFNLKRLLNVAFGVERKDDKLPEIVLEPYCSGPIAGVTPRDQFEKALREYYSVRGWDWASGLPRIETAKEMGLLRVAEELGLSLPS